MKRFMIYAAAMMALVACSNDEENYIDDPVAVQISASIGDSRAEGTDWTAGDEIGVTLDDHYVNVRYTTGGDGDFTGNTIYFRNKRVPATLTAYYPYSGAEGTAPDIITVSTAAPNQTAALQPSIDFLYDKKTNVIGDIDPKVRFSFSHRMGKLTLVFKNGDGMDVSKINSYEISGLVMDGTFDPATGVCAPKEGSGAENIKISCSGVTHGAELPYLILLPQDAPDNAVKLSITDTDGQYYECPLTFSQGKLAAGNNYLFTIKVSKKGLVIEDYSIDDWTTTESSSSADSVNPKN